MTLILYFLDTYKAFSQLCPAEQTGKSIFLCAVGSVTNSWEPAVVIITVAGCVWAAIALSRKTRYAIRITGCVLLWLFVVAWLPTVKEALDMVMNDDVRLRIIKLEMYRQQKTLNSAQVIWSAVWLGYLIRSKRVRQVYGRNLLSEAHHEV